jgi:chemotaxis protein methyltransferase CheR
MDTSLFQRFAEIAYAKAGISLRSGKEALVATRVGKRVRALGLAGANEYLDYLTGSGGDDELVNFLDVISTNVTSFFREGDHFDVLRDHVQWLIRAGRTRLRFWSAACSSGEEPYSMAMTIASAVGSERIDWRILATDISTVILARAKQGKYAEAALEKVPRDLRAKYWRRATGGEAGERQWELDPTVKGRVLFKRLNLTAPPLPIQGPIDAVFCRNVMIYFDLSVRQRVVGEIDRVMADDGVFCIGHSETLSGIDARFRLVAPATYMRPEVAALRKSALPPRMGGN